MYDLRKIYEARLKFSLPIQRFSLIQIFFFSYFCYYGYICYIFIVTTEEFCKTVFFFAYKNIETDMFMTFTFLCTSILTNN